MDTKEHVKQAIEQTRRACIKFVYEGITALSNPMNTRTDLMKTTGNIGKLVKREFELLSTRIDELPICGPVQFGPPGCEFVRPEPILETIPAGSPHMDRIVAMWIATESDEVVEVYQYLLTEAHRMADYLNKTRKDGEDSSQC